MFSFFNNNNLPVTKHRHSETLVKALSFVENKDLALNLGAVDLEEVKYLISSGFKKVTVINRHPLPEAFFMALPQSKFECVCLKLEQFKFPLKTFKLVNAQNSLPFTPPEIFPAVWDGVKKSLTNSGIFVGQFFGIKDSRNVPQSNMVFHTAAQVSYLLEGMEILEFRREEEYIFPENQTPQHRQIFHVVARAK